MGLPAFKLPGEFVPVSADDYLAAERGAETRHEYAYGRVWAMAGAEMAHNDINYNLNQFIGPRLRQQGCKANMSDLRVQTKNRSGYLYPDTVVVCGTPVLSDDVKPRSLINPILIVEVTSASTVERDHYEKFTLYRQIETLRQYLMLSSEAVHAELYTLDEVGRWIFTETRDPNAVLDLSSIGCQVPLAEVYGTTDLTDFNG